MRVAKDGLWKRLAVLLAGAGAAALVSLGAAEAQETTGVPGAPNATTTIDGHMLPPPPPKFGGEIELNAAQSTPWWAPRVVPPKGAPNVLLILIDDEGYGAPSTFGGVIPTPALDAVAAEGLRYTEFPHDIALLADARGVDHRAQPPFGPIRRDLRAIHRLPGLQQHHQQRQRDYRAHPARERLPHILVWQGSQCADLCGDPGRPLRPVANWHGLPTFLRVRWGRRSQWQPNLFNDTTAIYPYIGHPGWNLITAMADDAIHWVNQLNDIDPTLPFLLYYAPGATHAPHHPTPEWVDKVSAMHLFDQGWNKLRDQIFANQKKLGVIPQEAKLTPWPHDLMKNWDELTDIEKKLFIRQADVYAAYLAYTDHEIGRVIQAVKDLGKFDNTLIVFINGDNGASAEGSPNGTPSEMMAFNGITLPAEAQMKWYDVWGTDQTYNHFAVPWAWAFDTPFKWTKQIPSFFGGTRNGMVISWPDRIKDKGGVRWQFHHVIDVVPTILEATGIPAPNMVDGIAQKPIEGTSMVYSFDHPDVASPHKTQYFEMMGVQGLYSDGWMLSAVPVRAPWELLGKAIQDPASAYKFELYDVRKDWTQNTDVAADNPAKMREMTDRMFGEFAKYDVLPLDASVATRLVAPRPNLTAGRKVFNYTGEPVTGLPISAAPNLLNTSYTITAEVDVPKESEGVVVKQGGRFGGYGLYFLKGKPVFTWNLLDLNRVKWQGDLPLDPGKHTIVFDFKYDGLGFATLAFNSLSGIGRSGVGTLSVDGKTVATEKLERTIPLTLPVDETFDIGSATGTPVDDADYQVPFRFNGKIEKFQISLDPPVLTEDDKKKLMEADHAAQDAN